MREDRAIPYDVIRQVYDIRKRPGWNQVHSVSDRCVNCKYLTGSIQWSKGKKYFRNPSCDYIGIVGKARMCPAGDKCTKYERGDGRNDGCIIDLNMGI